MNKKTLSLLLSLILSLVLVTSVSASSVPQTASYSDAQKSNIVTREVPSSIIMPFDAQVIPTLNHTGKAAYTGTFTTAPENGKFLNVWVKNNGTGTVYLTIKRNGTDFVADIAIAAGSQRTQQFEQLVGTGVTGDWEVYVYNTTGASMDLDIAARQF